MNIERLTGTTPAVSHLGSVRTLHYHSTALKKGPSVSAKSHKQALEPSIQVPSDSTSQ